MPTTMDEQTRLDALKFLAERHRAQATSLYLAYLHMANNRNKTIAENAENAIVALLRSDKADLDLFSFKRHWVSWSTLRSGSSTWTWLWQTLILFLFARSHLDKVFGVSGSVRTA